MITSLADQLNKAIVDKFSFNLSITGIPKGAFLNMKKYSVTVNFRRKNPKTGIIEKSERDWVPVNAVSKNAAKDICLLKLQKCEPTAIDTSLRFVIKEIL